MMIPFFTRVSLIICILLSVLIEIKVNAATTNSTFPEKIVCVYPLSGQYGLLPRVLYYCLLIFSALAQRQVWLIAGAMASALTYSGTAAIHAVILAGASQSWIFDLDALGVWAIVSTGCLAVIPVLDWSHVLVESQFRPVFGFWGFLMALASACGSVPLYRSHVPEVACRSDDQALLLTSPRQLETSGFNCTYACFSTRQVLRHPSEITVIASEQVNGTALGLTKIAIALVLTGSCVLAIFACCLTTRKRTEAELRACIERNRARRADALLRGLWGKKKARRLAQKELETGQVQLPRSVWGYMNPILFPALVVLNEICLLGNGGLPSNEHLYAIGQWAPWVGVALAIIAAGIIRYKEPQWRERQAILTQERAALEQRMRGEGQAEVNNQRQSSENHTDHDQLELQPYRSQPTDEDTPPGCSSSKSVRACSSKGQLGSNATTCNRDTRTGPSQNRGVLHIFSRMPVLLKALSRTRTKSDLEATGARTQ